MSALNLCERSAAAGDDGERRHTPDDGGGAVRESVMPERCGGGGGKGEGEAEGRRRARTIIVEKQDGSYGFTLQSYGIHYKKEQEIEVITYVEQVEPAGGAGRAGMREGDVILSIDGADVARADHAAIVRAVAGCGARMRVVVVFEDCVRKVELHLQYINIQRALRQRLRALEQLAARERQLLDRDWKTHSLPSQRKKGPPAAAVEHAAAAVADSAPCRRPARSSENVTPPVAAGVLVYRYLEPAGRDCRHYVLESAAAAEPACRRAAPPPAAAAAAAAAKCRPRRPGHGHSCPPCVPSPGSQDASSLEAYELASPCCEPRCVPHSRRKTRRKKDCTKEHKRKEKCQQVDKSTQKHENCAQSRTKKTCPSGHCSSRYRYLTSESTQTSQCSLQSHAGGAGGGGHSASSYTTSLSSDTLFWETDRSEPKCSPKIQYQSAQHHIKPKSWDNLTTRAWGGYGFGYGYLDTAAKHSSGRSKSHGGRGSAQSHREHEHGHGHAPRQSAPHRCGGGGHCAPAKSTESLVALQEGGGGGSCDSLDHCRRAHLARSAGAHCYTQHFIYPTHVYNKKDPNVSSEITRL